jgi:hypothetical protein
MIAVDIQVSGLDEVKGMLGDLSGQMPFTISTAINWTLNDIQGAVRTHVHDEFTVRSPEYIDRSIYIGGDDRARKDNLNGTVRVNPQRDQLAKFENDQVKTPASAANVAIPIFKQNAPGLIIRRGDALSVNNLLAAIDSARNGKSRSKGNKARLRKQSLFADVNGKRIFLVKTRTGATLLVERTGKGASGSMAGSRVLWAFRPSVPLLSHRLEFAEVALRAALQTWEENCTRAINRALETAK